MSHLSSLHALSFLNDWFKGMLSAKFIVVPLILNITFLVYDNFISFGFRLRSTFGVYFLKYFNMIWTMHIMSKFSLCLQLILKTYVIVLVTNIYVFYITYHLWWIFLHCSIFSCLMKVLQMACVHLVVKDKYELMFYVCIFVY